MFLSLILCVSICGYAQKGVNIVDMPQRGIGTPRGKFIPDPPLVRSRFLDQKNWKILNIQIFDE